MSCPFAGLATRYTLKDERVSVRICGAVPYERASDPEDLPLPSVCFSQAAWQSCPHYLRLIQRKEVAQRLGLVPADGDTAPAHTNGNGDGALIAEEIVTLDRRHAPAFEERRRGRPPKSLL
jgi:hypothetical protein